MQEQEYESLKTSLSANLCFLNTSRGNFGVIEIDT